MFILELFNRVLSPLVLNNEKYECLFYSVLNLFHLLTFFSNKNIVTINNSLVDIHHIMYSIGLVKYIERSNEIFYVKIIYEIIPVIEI